MTEVTTYFDRIGYSGRPEPTLDTLHALVAAHNSAIPFENLDPLLGVPVADLSRGALSDKLVNRRRGGYCYEHNGLLGYVLDELGFGVERYAGRVLWMHPDDSPPALTHQVLGVTIPGEDGRFLVDVGFGGQTLTSPIRLLAGPVQQTRHEPYRLSAHHTGYLLEAQIRGEWQPLYVFSPEPQPLIDLEVGSWYVSTHPESKFVTALSAAIVTDDARWNLRGCHLAVHRADGSEKLRLGSAAEVLDVLSDRFGIALSDLGDAAKVEARVNEVLDR